MTLELYCKSDDVLSVNIDECVKHYKKLLADGETVSIEEYVRDFWCGQEDNIYYCDNSEELQTEICNAMRAQLDGKPYQQKEEKQKVYIISSCDDNWSSQLEITNATLSPDKAKEIIVDTILDGFDPEDEENLNEYFKTPEDWHKYINEFAQDMVDGKNEHHYCDEFDGVRIWCDVIELE